MDLDWAGGGYTNLFDISGGNAFKVLGSTVSTGPRSRRGRERAHHPVRRRHPGGPGPHHERDDQPVLHDECPQLQDRLRPRRVLRRLYREHDGQSELRPIHQQPPDHGRAARQQRYVRDVGSRRHGRLSFALERSETTGTNIVLVSNNTNAVTVPPDVNFAAGSNTVTFNATVVSLTAGNATIYATNPATGARAVLAPVAPSLYISGDAVQAYTGGPKTYGGPFGLGRDEPRAFQLRHRRGDGAGRAELPGECLHQHVLGHVPRRLDDAGGQQPGHGRGRRVFRDLPGAQADADRPAPELGGQR